MTMTISKRGLLAGAVAAATLVAGLQGAIAEDKVKIGALRFTSHAGGFIAANLLGLLFGRVDRCNHLR